MFKVTRQCSVNAKVYTVGSIVDEAIARIIGFHRCENLDPVTVAVSEEKQITKSPKNKAILKPRTTKSKKK